MTVENRLLIHTPTGRDGRLIANVLEQAGIECFICVRLENVINELSLGAGALILADEALSKEFLKAIRPFIDNQKSWSDFPFLVLRQTGQDTPEMRSRY